MASTVKINSKNVSYTDNFIETNYEYATSIVHTDCDGSMIVEPQTVSLKIRTDRHVPKLGLMLVGWGGNNGSTITAAFEANRKRLEWRTKTGVQQANWFGSITQASTILMGTAANGKDVFAPMNQILPMVNPDDIVIDGWDISSMNLGDAMVRAAVLDVGLQDQVYKKMFQLKPRPSIYDRDFIAANQEERVDNVINGTRLEQMNQIRADIRDFKQKSGVDKVIVLWTANTERFAGIEPGLNTTMRELEQSLAENKSEISPSTIFAMASILEKCTYINGSPQNTFVPGLIEMAEHYGVHIAGDDFKSGQTKLKSVLVDFLVGAGIKPVSIVSYNHLGNNDGKNLSAPQQFRSKEISKSNVVDDMVESNGILYQPNEHPDHCVVIKYVPYVGDSKRAMDEYTSQIMLGGHNTLVIHNTCEDSLLASPLILDLAILGELCSRITVKRTDSNEQYVPFRSVLSILSYMCKAPLVPNGTPVVNSLFRQRSAIENILRACVGLQPNHHMSLEHRFELGIISQNSMKTEQSTIESIKMSKQCNTNGHTNGHSNGYSNGHSNGFANGHKTTQVVN